MRKKKVRNYDKEFKLNVINLFLKREKTYKQLSEELGVPEKTLISWVHLHKKSGGSCFPGKGNMKEPDIEMLNLRKRLAIAEEERDILKKALGIFSLQLR
jgi:transposase